MNTSARTTAIVRDRISENEVLRDLCCRWVINDGLDDVELALQLKARIAPVFPLDNAPSAQYERDLFYRELEDLGDVLEPVNWGELAKAVRALVI